MMQTLLDLMVKYYMIDGAIYLMGFFSIFLVADRVKALYFDLAMNNEPFIKKIVEHVSHDQIEEAIALCSMYPKKPVPRVIKAILERSDREEVEYDRACDRASGEVSPMIVKRMSYLPMVSNVVTLIGLLGTVAGLVISFQAISFADPAQKQSLLANGISLAMHATATGLMVAIPVMVIYSWLYSRQGQIFTELDRHSQAVIDSLRSRVYSYPVVETTPQLKTPPTPPPPGKSKVA